MISGSGSPPFRGGSPGLAVVGLARSTRKDCRANGRYFFRPRPAIHIYSYPDSLSYRLDPHTGGGDVERGLRVELEFGMQVVRLGSRWTCVWEPDSLRRFILEEVLPHEVGHHVYAMRRLAQGLVHRSRTRESEQQAEAYAARWRRQRGL